MYRFTPSFLEDSLHALKYISHRFLITFPKDLKMRLAGAMEEGPVTLSHQHSSTDGEAPWGLTPAQGLGGWGSRIAFPISPLTADLRPNYCITRQKTETSKLLLAIKWKKEKRQRDVAQDSVDGVDFRAPGIWGWPPADFPPQSPRPSPWAQEYLHTAGTTESCA